MSIRIFLFLHLLGCYCSSYEITSSSSIREIVELDIDTIHGALRSCRIDSVADNDEICSRVEYVSRYLDFRDDFLSANSIKVSTKVQNVIFVENSTDYQTLFEDYVLKNRYILISQMLKYSMLAFQIYMSSRAFVSSSPAVDTSLLEPCHSANPFTQDYPISLCNNVRLHLYAVCWFTLMLLLCFSLKKDSLTSQLPEYWRTVTTSAWQTFLNIGLRYLIMGAIGLRFWILKQITQYQSILVLLACTKWFGVKMFLSLFACFKKLSHQY